MFNSITGIITAKYPQRLCVENNGIEFDFLMPESSLNIIGNLNDKVKVYVWLYHKEDSMKLFGFASDIDRSVFLDLLKVDGVGPKGAIKILSNISCKELVTALDNEDFGTIEKVQGIGKKTAQKMMLTLKGKLSLQNDTSSSGRKIASKWQDVIFALMNMGYDKKQIELVIEKVQVDLKDELSKITSDAQKEEAIFRRAIVELAQ